MIPQEKRVKQIFLKNKKWAAEKLSGDPKYFKKLAADQYAVERTVHQYR
jgi:hypothetical protein